MSLRAEPGPGSRKAADLTFPEFCRYVDILPKTGGRIAFPPESWNREQRDLDARRTGRDLVLKSRQIGVSTLELARDLWTAITKPGTNTLAIVHEEDAARKFASIWRVMCQALRRHGMLPKTSTLRVGEIVFEETGSTVRVTEAGATEPTAEKKGRSGAIYRFHGSEVAYWRSGEKTLEAARGGLVAEGEEILESTANGAAGSFWSHCMAALEGRGEHRLHFWPWHFHAEYRKPVGPGFSAAPRDDIERQLRAASCDDEQIAWWRAKVDNPATTLDSVLEEFPISALSAFRSGGGQYIDASTCDWLDTQVRKPLRELDVYSGKLRIYTEPAAGRSYLAGGDVAEGLGPDGDASAWDFIDRRTGLTVATWWSDVTEPADMALAGAEVGKLYNHALLAPERNKDGATVLVTLERTARYGNVYKHEDGRLGWPTNGATRPPLFDEQAQAFRDKSQPTPDTRVASEARTLHRDRDGKPRARGKGTRGGARDDAFVARAIATQVRIRQGTGTGTAHRTGISSSGGFSTF